LSLSRTRAASAFNGWLRGCTIIASVMALALLPVEASRAGWLDFFKGKKSDAPKSAGSSKPAEPAKHAARAKHLTPKDAASSLQAAAAKLRSVKPEVAEEPPPSKLMARKCDPGKFRIVVDVGHTAESEGALSARNVPEFNFNLNLSKRIVERLKADGFAQAKLLVTEGKARPSLGRRVAAANNLHADLFLSIHHDSVPDKLMEEWEYEGKKSHFSDRFSGYGVFVSKSNPDFESSFRFARLIGKQMRLQGFKFANQYTLPIMGKYRRELLDREAGVYRYDELIVLKTTNMPAALLEAGSIINRDEELEMASAERHDKTVSAVTTALKEYCGLPPAPPQTPPDAQAKMDH
jgi:N-acetylmuramoyl-L-alanine amidase